MFVNITAQYKQMLINEFLRRMCQNFAMEQLFETLRCKLEVRVFDSWRCHRNFSLNPSGRTVTVMSTGLFPRGG